MGRSPGLEAATLEALWSADDWMLVREVRDRLLPQRQVAYTTVMTAFHRLWWKGELRRRKVGRGHSYRPKLSRTEHVALRMREVLDAPPDAATLTRFVDALPEDQQALLRRYLGDT